MRALLRWLACAAVLAPSFAIAQPHSALEDARAAYDRGAAAYDAGQYAVAAAEFARADELVANSTTLTLAINAAVRVGDPVLGMALVERAETRPTSAELTAAVTSAREKFASRVGKVAIRCPATSACRAQIDGVAATVGTPRWVLVGEHAVDLDVDGVVQHHPIRVDPGALVEVKPDAERTSPPPVGPSASPRPSATAAPPPPPPPARDEGSGASPALFWFATGLTVVVGGVTLWSALDTVKQHDAFVSAPTTQGQSDGRSAQTRTNVLLGVTGAAALTTAVIGVFIVQWRRPSEPGAERPQLGLALSPAGVALTGRY